MLKIFSIGIFILILFFGFPVYAQQPIEFTPDDCHEYYFDKDIFVPFQILFYFPEADRGKFQYDALRDDASYWVEKAEDFDREEGTFLGVGSNSTKRWEWQFDLQYNQSQPLGRDFNFEIISNGKSIVRQIFPDTARSVCVYANFNAEVEPKRLTNDEIVKLGVGIAQDEINSVKAEIRRNTQESVQTNNLNITATVIMALFVATLWATNHNRGRQLGIRQKQVDVMLIKAKQDRESSKRREDYYSLKLGDMNTVIKTKMNEINDVFRNFRDVERTLNNIQYIYDFIKKNVGGIAEVEDNLKSFKDVKVEPEPIVEPKDESTIDKIIHKVKPNKEQKTSVYLQYKDKMKKMNEHEKFEFIGKQWDIWYPKSISEDSEGREHVEALLRLDKELR